MLTAEYTRTIFGSEHSRGRSDPTLTVSILEDIGDLTLTVTVADDTIPTFDNRHSNGHYTYV